MSRGYVYILSNPSMPGLVKIGRTTRDVEQRASELWQTGVPTPFTVEEAIHTPDCAQMEAAAHEHFSNERMSPSREFFGVSVLDARGFLTGYLNYQIQEFVAQFDETAVIVPDVLHVGEPELLRLAAEIEVEYYEIAQIIEELLPDEIQSARNRYFEKRHLRKLREKHGLGVGSLDLEEIKAEMLDRGIGVPVTEEPTNGPH